MADKKTNQQNPKVSMVTVGGSGTDKQAGFIYEEYNSKLQGLQGIKKYEEMRSGDATVQAILLAMELPILSTKWEVKPGQTNGEVTKQDEEIAEFINTALLKKISFKRFLRQSLTNLAFGFSVFEKVFKLENGKIYWEKISQRLQKSIYKWESEAGEPGVVQNLFNEPGKENQVFIPRNKLIVFSHRQEGDNYEGKSALRAAYKHWYIKDQLYKYQAVGFEKQAVGIPVMKMPKGSTKKDQTEAEEILEGIRATEQSRVLLPNGDWSFEFADMKGKSNADPEKAINHHDRQITKAVLAHFMELGATEGGSYALSEDQSSLFMLGLQAIADEIAETINKEAIEELVNINFTLVENQTYPTLEYQKLGDIDLEKLINAITSATSGGLVTPDANIEIKLRKLLDLPEVTKETKKLEPKKQEKNEKEVKNQIKEKSKKKEEKKPTSFTEEVLYFSEKTQVKESVAKKILQKIYKKGLDPKDLAIIIENLKFKLRDDIDVVALLNKASDKVIDETIEDLVDWKNEIGKRELMGRHNFSETELKALGFEDEEEAKQFAESKKIFNFIESLNI